MHSADVCLLAALPGDPEVMWTAEEARQYVATVADVPADDLRRLFLPGKPASSYCFLQDVTDTTHVAHFRDGRDEPLVLMVAAS